MGILRGISGKVTAQKDEVFIKTFFSKYDFLTFTEEIFNGQLHFLYSGCLQIFLRYRFWSKDSVQKSSHAPANI